MNAEEMFKKLGYKRNLDSKKIIYEKELKGMFHYFEITFNLTEKEVELYDDYEAYTINKALLKAIQQQLKELGWLEEETCTNGSTYDSTEEFICSHCGLTLIEYKEYVNGEDDGEGYYFDFKPKYCPNCGRKIVD
nr:MAG TPA: Thaumarchaeal output domain 1 [Caudoviricetes sp.]